MLTGAIAVIFYLKKKVIKTKGYIYRFLVSIFCRNIGLDAGFDDGCAQ